VLDGKGRLGVVMLPITQRRVASRLRSKLGRRG
jgi:hypothetical protein